MDFVTYHKDAFRRIGWFLPPYASLRFLGGIAKKIYEQGDAFTQSDLEGFLCELYSPLALAAMVTERYPQTPHIQDYQGIIAEAIEAHFLGLHHVAVSGLLPVVEGAARKLAKSRDVEFRKTNGGFLNLATDCKREVQEKRIGAVDEVIGVLDSFVEFTKEHLYTHSDNFWLPDNTNRNGILHGAYADADYGRPVNFYKTISAVDLLCLVSSIRAPVSWLAPDLTPASRALAAHYLECKRLGGSRPALREVAANL